MKFVAIGPGGSRFHAVRGVALQSMPRSQPLRSGLDNEFRIPMLDTQRYVPTTLRRRLRVVLFPNA
jgi:hypothetical protein